MRSLSVKFKNDTNAQNNVNSNPLINFQYNAFNDLYDALQLNVDMYTEVSMN